MGIQNVAGLFMMVLLASIFSGIGAHIEWGANNRKQDQDKETDPGVGIVAGSGVEKGREDVNTPADNVQEIVARLQQEQVLCRVVLVVVVMMMVTVVIVVIVVIVGIEQRSSIRGTITRWWWWW